MSLPQTYTAVISNGKGKEVTVEQLPLPTPGTNQLLIKVAFAPINPSDILFINQAYASTLKPPYPVGFEGSGTVVAVGNDLKVPYQIGDRVHVYSQGTFGQYLVADAGKCRKIQDGLSFEDAAPHYVNPLTVVAMGDYVKKNGHKALIHTAGTSALGRMIIRYFKHKGVKTINIVRKSEFIEELKKDGADYVLNSQEPDFETQLKEIAQKENATLAFDAVGGDFTTKVLKNQPEGSVLALYGALAGANISNLNVLHFIFEGKTVTGFYLTKYLENAFKAGEGEKLLNESYELLPTVLKSNVQKVFGLEDIKEALALYQTNSSNGKILIKPN